MFGKLLRRKYEKEEWRAEEVEKMQMNQNLCAPSSTTVIITDDESYFPLKHDKVPENGFYTNWGQVQGKPRKWWSGWQSVSMAYFFQALGWQSPVRWSKVSKYSMEIVIFCSGGKLSLLCGSVPDSWASMWYQIRKTADSSPRALL